MWQIHDKISIDQLHLIIKNFYMIVKKHVHVSYDFLWYHIVIHQSTTVNYIPHMEAI